MDEQKTPQLNTLTTPSAIIIAGLLIAGGIYFGLSGNVVKLGTSSTDGSQVNVVTTVPSQDTVAGAQDRPPSIVTISVDDDPVLGNPQAPVTLIEFSDYECPFCKRHFDQTLPSLKSEYIDKGLLKFVFRDLPLTFHDPMATTEAIAANCARDQKGDPAYFEYHDEIFTRTTSNGNGLSKDDLYAIAKENGLNQTAFKTCLDTEKFKGEVTQDLQAAAAAGATGTPTFFVGKSSESGEIEGEIIIGALPYSAMKVTIEKYLN